MTPLALPWRRRLRIAAEFGAMFGLLLLADHLVTGGTGFAAIQPNPFWLPVLIMALAYGTEAGLGAAVIASWIWLTRAQANVAQGDYLDRLLHLSLTPLLWFLVAALVGEVTILRAHRNARLKRDADIAARNVDRLSQAYQQLTVTNRALQVRIAVGSGTTGHIVALATDLSAPARDDRRAAIGELIALAAGTTDFTCYRTDRDGSPRVWLRGTSAAPRADILPTPLLTKVRTTRRTLCVVHVEDRALLADVGVAAVPLVTGDGTAIGCLIVHSLPFAALNTQSIAELTEIGTWLPALAADGAGVTQPQRLYRR